MSDQRLLWIIVEETARSPNRQADGSEVRRLYGDGFDAAFEGLGRLGYIAVNPLQGHIALTPAGLAAARGVPASSLMLE
jgi:hypothetical protein